MALADVSCELEPPLRRAITTTRNLLPIVDLELIPGTGFVQLQSQSLWLHVLAGEA